jgi:hypothetical protein
MRKLFIAIFLLYSSVSFSQYENTDDYFSIGLYGGNYFARLPIYPSNKYLSSISAELEFHKSDVLSIFGRGIYVFTGNDPRIMYLESKDWTITTIGDPNPQRAVFLIGGKYYLRTKNINPYIQLGLSEEITDIKEFEYIKEYYLNGHLMEGHIQWVGKESRFTLSVFAGVGLSFKLSKKFTFDFDYNLYQDIEKVDGQFLGHSVFGGIKYNL